MKQKAAIIGGLLIMVLSLGLVVHTVQERQSYIGRAAEPLSLSQIDPEQQKKLHALNQQLITSTELTTKENREFGYKLNYDPKVWQEPTVQAVNTVHQFLLTTRPEIGAATFTLDITPFNANQSIAAWIDGQEADFRNQDTLVSREITTLGTKEAYKFTLQEEYFGQMVSFTRYFVSVESQVYTITVKYGNEEMRPVVEELLNQLSFISPQKAKAVRGANTKTVNFEAAQLAELSRPSVVSILTAQCINIQGNNTQYITSYQYCSTGKGTGWIVGEEGFIATNGHVIRHFPEQIMAEQLLRQPEHPFLHDLIQEVNAATGKSVSEIVTRELIEEIQTNPNAHYALVRALLELMEQGKVTAAEERAVYFVQLGNQPFVVSDDALQSGDVRQVVKTTQHTLQATLVDVEVDNPFAPAFILRGGRPSSTDIGLLKLVSDTNHRFPALPLAHTQPGLGDQIEIIGFPSLVEGDRPGSLIDYQTSSNAPTVTRGIVSSIKFDAGGHKLIQTDASIEHGNSGGPALNTFGEVIGLATFGVEGELGNFNFIRDIFDMEQLLEKNSVNAQTNTVYFLWRRGMSDFWQGYYTRSLDSFNGVKNKYPLHPTVDEYIKEAKTYIQAQKDRGLLFGIDKDVLKLGVGIVGFGAALVWFGFALRRYYMRQSLYNFN